MRFGRFLAGKHYDLVRTCRGKPILPEPLPSAVASFRAMEYGKETELWAFADQKTVFAYLRGGKHLCITSRMAGSDTPLPFPAPSN